MNWLKKHKIISTILGLAVIFWFIGFAGGSLTPSKEQVTTKVTAITQLPKKVITTPIPTLTAKQIISKFESESEQVTVENIYKTPNSYKGKSLIFTCTVSSFPKDENGNVAALNCDDPNDYASYVQIGIGKDVDVTKINKNDSIKVYGMGLGSMNGQNGYGVSVSTGAILGLYINDLTTGYTNY